MEGRRHSLRFKKRRKKGMEAITEPGLGALYLRIPWMKKLDDMKKAQKKKKQLINPRSRVKRP